MSAYPPDYQKFRGQWEDLPIGSQFKTTTFRVLGSIFQRDHDSFWYAQKYNSDFRIYRFAEKDQAQMYVESATEESRLAVISLYCVDTK